MDLLTRQEKGSPLDHQEVDANFIAIQQELENKLAAEGHEGAGGEVHALASPDAHGFMSKEDKAKLNAVATGAAAVGDDAPASLGAANPGVSAQAAREDHVHPSTGTTQPLANNSTEYATTAFCHALMNALINGAPGVLDQLNEFAEAINNDPDFAGSVFGKLDKKGSKTNVIYATGAAEPGVAEA